MSTNTAFIKFNKHQLIAVCLVFILTACGGTDDTLSLSGTVLDSNGTPVPNAMVTIHSDPIVVHTDSNGAFHCRIRPGHHHFRAEKQGRVFLDFDFDANESAGGHHDLKDIKSSTNYTANATLSSIAITPPTATVAIGQSMAFTAIGTYSDATNADLTSQVTWSTADNTIATIDSAGTASGVKPGNTSVSALFSAINAPTASILVELPALNPVAALFPINGANWNDYVAGNASTATDTACNAATDNACVHGGERRVVAITGKTSCTGLSAADDLGAFNWVCDGSSNPVRMVSTGLANGKNLSDLIDFVTPGFKSNKVTVYENAIVLNTTPSTVWWSNPVAVNNTDGSLVTASTIYLVTAQPSPAVSYTMDANKAALVIQPGLGLTGPGIGSSVILSSNRDHLWLEGAINASSDSKAVDLRYVRFSVLRNVKAYNASTDGIYLGNTWFNRVSGITASNNIANGVNLATSSSNVLSGINVSNNGSMGVYLNSTSNKNVLSDVTASNNNYGVVLWNASDSTVSNVTASNNKYGVYIYTALNNTLSRISASNSTNYGVVLSSSSNNTLSDVTSSQNGYGVYLATASNNRFTGLLQVGGNTSDCTVSGGTNPGLVTTTCANNGTSDATLTTAGITLANSFVGKVTSDDAQNTSDSSGAASFPTDPTSFDWTHFDNAYRGWGIDGSAFPSADQRGRWTMSTPGGAGRIWDWSVLSSDLVLLNVLPLPTGNDTITQTWSDASTTSFLRHAMEIPGDGIGNDNGLCESGETCVYTPNIGSYQGHGNLVSTGTFTDGSLTGITLMKFANNGQAAQP